MRPAMDSETKLPQSPWRYSEVNNEVYDAQGQLVAVPEEQSSSGPLIAAAPDLLVALKAIIEADDDYRATSPSMPKDWLSKACDAGRAALSKATQPQEPT